MLTSETVNELCAALAKAQGAMANPKKNKTVSVGNKYGYNYADLAEISECIRKPLAENGLSIVQFPSTSEKAVKVTTTLFHSSGQFIQSEICMSVANQMPQTVGSAITYARRYSISSMLGLAADDDDDATMAEDKGTIAKPVLVQEKPIHKKVVGFDKSNENHVNALKKAVAERKIEPKYFEKIKELMVGKTLDKLDEAICQVV